MEGEDAVPRSPRRNAVPPAPTEDDRTWSFALSVEGKVLLEADEDVSTTAAVIAAVAVAAAAAAAAI